MRVEAQAALCLYLYVSVGKQQVHDNVLSEDLCVVDSEFDTRKLLGQLLSLVLLPGLPDVIEQRVLEGGTEGDGQKLIMKSEIFEE